MNNLSHYTEPYQEIVTILGIVSVITFLLSLIVIPWLVVKLPKDYFNHQQRQTLKSQRSARHWHFVLVLLKNLLGFILVLAGIAMLVLPGQGALTLLIGLSLTNFPGKYAIQQRLISVPGISKALNWLRCKAGKAEFEIPKRMP